MIVIKLAQYNELVSQISRQFVILDLKNCFRKFDLVYINKNTGGFELIVLQFTSPIL